MPKFFAQAFAGKAVAVAPPTPTVPLPPPTPEEDPETQKKIDKAQEAARRPRGQAATLLTGGSGDISSVSSARKTLLGA
jgi:hypothetical protein